MDEEKKAEIYIRYKDKVTGYICGKVNDRDLAEDLCSEVFLKVYSKIDTFDESKASVSTWIYTITRNTLTDWYRTRKVTSEIPETLISDDSPEDEICKEEMLSILADALESLDDRERSIIVLHFYSELTLKDTADRLGISYAYVKVLKNRALEKMRKFF